jgi:hypothetical protein
MPSCRAMLRAVPYLNATQLNGFPDRLETGGEETKCFLGNSAPLCALRLGLSHLNSTSLTENENYLLRAALFRFSPRRATS